MPELECVPMMEVEIVASGKNGQREILATVRHRNGAVTISSLHREIKEEMTERGIRDIETLSRYFPKDGEKFIAALLRAFNRGYLRCIVRVEEVDHAQFKSS